MALSGFNENWPENWLRRIPIKYWVAMLVVLSTALSVLAVQLGISRESVLSQNDSLAELTDELTLSRDSLITINDELAAEQTRTESLLVQTQVLYNQLSITSATNDSLLRVTTTNNEDLRVQYSALQIAQQEALDARDSTNVLLGITKDQADSLDQSLQLSNDLRIQTVTIALASKATVESNRNDGLSALLALQALKFYDAGNKEFKDQVYHALRLSANAIEDNMGGPAEVYADENNQVLEVATSQDGRWLASANSEGSILLWESPLEPSTFRPLLGHSAAVTTISFSPKGNQLISGSLDKTVRLWNLEDRTHEVIRRHSAAIRRVLFSPDGQYIAVIDSDSQLVVSSSVQGEEPIVISAPYSNASAITFSPQGDFLLTGGDDAIIRQWRLSELDAPPVEIQHPASITSLAFHPAGNQLASAGANRDVYLWQLRDTIAITDTLRGHTGVITDIVYSPSGELLATSSRDNSIMLWELTPMNRDPVVFQDNNEWIHGLAFHPDGESLFSAGEDGTVYRWFTLMNTLRDAICQSVAIEPFDKEAWDEFVGPDLDKDKYDKICDNSPLQSE